MTEEDNITEEQAEQLVRNFAESKETTTGFFTKVVKNPDTTKTGNLSIDELGMPSHTVRGLKELAVFCRDVCSDNTLANYYDKLAEVSLATSLSKDAKLIGLVGTTRREIADVSPKERKVNKGWFKKNKEDKEQNT